MTSFPHVSPPKRSMHLNVPLYMPHSVPVSLCVVLLPEIIFMRSTNRDASSQAVPFRLMFSFSLLERNISLSTPFSNTASLYFSFSVRDKGAHPCRIIVIFVTSKI